MASLWPKMENLKRILEINVTQHTFVVAEEFLKRSKTKKTLPIQN